MAFTHSKYGKLVKLNTRVLTYGCMAATPETNIIFFTLEYLSGDGCYRL